MKCKNVEWKLAEIEHHYGFLSFSITLLPSMRHSSNERPTILFAMSQETARCCGRGAWLLVGVISPPPFFFVFDSPHSPTFATSPPALPLDRLAEGRVTGTRGRDDKHIVMVKLYGSCFISHKIVNCISILIYVCIYNFKCTHIAQGRTWNIIFYGRWNESVICFCECWFLLGFLLGFFHLFCLIRCFYEQHTRWSFVVGHAFYSMIILNVVGRYLYLSKIDF